MARPRFHFGRIDTLRSRIARKPGVFTYVFVLVLLFIIKPTRLAMGYLIPSAIKIAIADWYAEAWEDMNTRKTIVIPLKNHPRADTVWFLYDQDSFFVMKVYSNRNGIRQELQYLRPTDLPILVIDKTYYPDSTVEIRNYFHRKRMHHKSQLDAPKRVFTKEQRQMQAKELFSLYYQLRPLYVKPE